MVFKSPPKLAVTFVLVTLGTITGCGDVEPVTTPSANSGASAIAINEIGEEPGQGDLGVTNVAVLDTEPPEAVETSDAAETSATVTKKSTWATGYCADVTVTNTSSAPLVWEVTVPADGEVTRAWRASWAAAEGGILARGLDFNRELAAGEVTVFGFCADTDGTTLPPVTPPTGPPSTPPVAADYGRLVLDEDFNDHSGSWDRYTLAMATEDFGEFGSRTPRGFDSSGDSWLADNRVGDGVLSANYPPRIAGGYNSGFIFDKFFSSAEEATFEYRLRFEGSGSNDDFEWAYGGKLPGLGGTSQSQSPTGCTTDDSQIRNGFSARLMWHRGGDLVTYMYLPNRDASKCGVSTTFLEDAQPDRWYTIRQHIKLNTPGQSNGLLEMFVDGEQAIRLTDVLYRESGKSSVKLNNILFHTYRGGAETDERFHSSKNERIHFDDFKVWVK